MPLPEYYSYEKRTPIDQRGYDTTPLYEENPNQSKPELYDSAPELSQAVNVAIYLGLPLLVTGDPGTGKTELAYSIAYQLNAPLLRFDTKTTSTATDLLYDFDVIGRFNDRRLEETPQRASHLVDIQEGLARRASILSGASDAEPSHLYTESQPGKDIEQKYITYRALGQAILLAQTEREFGLTITRRHFDPIQKSFKEETETYQAPCRAVVLIDEIDKAPRDLPNDLLLELDRMEFHVREAINLHYKADPAYRPILVLTSNSEKDFPDAFLRRCAYYHIPFPSANRLEKIVAGRLSPDAPADAYLTAAVRLFEAIRNVPRLKKKPATAELIAWMRLLKPQGITEAELTQAHDVYAANRPEDGEVRKALGSRLAPTYVALVKNQDDRRLLMLALHDTPPA